MREQQSDGSVYQGEGISTCNGEGGRGMRIIYGEEGRPGSRTR